MRHALDEWMKKASGKAVADYSFHMIVTELPDAGLGDMDTMVRNEGVTSFKLFMAYPGVFMVDDATIFRALRRTGGNGGLVCMHAENGGVIDLLVQEALRRGEVDPGGWLIRALERTRLAWNVKRVSAERQRGKSLPETGLSN